ncbi:Isoamyl acetate-hydrolyzing esterase [Phytophthora palmivora]|uniref:Isoamyl acetate-hydrolyzing esterase n=1 Tax=Phytophthora palmivora TaxID=4796 RepID=A0A2P4WWL6_9STRA|nr:Isoamyl acetate-hydrolyzing esterase [Phytophthora palmivora]
MIIDEHVKSGPITKAQPLRSVKKHYKVYYYIAILSVLVVAALVAILLILPQRFDDDSSSGDNSTQTHQRVVERPLFLFVGDSLTEQGIDPSVNGWITLLQYQYSRSCDIITRGLSGYNTRWYLKYAMPIILEEIYSRAYTPTFITVWLGTNDHALANGSDPERHVPLDQYKTNLIRIIRGFQAFAPDSNFFLITPSHIDDSVREKYAADRSDEKRGLADRTNAMAREYAKACVETAIYLDIPVFDLHTYFNVMSEATRNAFLIDGLHLNSKGNRIVSDQVIGMIESNFPEVSTRLQTLAYPPSKTCVEEDPWIPDPADAASG